MGCTGKPRPGSTVGSGPAEGTCGHCAVLTPLVWSLWLCVIVLWNWQTWIWKITWKQHQSSLVGQVFFPERWVRRSGKPLLDSLQLPSFLWCISCFFPLFFWFMGFRPDIALSNSAISLLQISDSLFFAFTWHHHIVCLLWVCFLSLILSHLITPLKMLSSGLDHPSTLPFSIPGLSQGWAGKWDLVRKERRRGGWAWEQKGL